MVQVLKLEENLKNGESSPDPDVDEFLKHVEESKQKLEDNQTKLEEVIVQDETTTVESKEEAAGDPALKKGRDLKYLVFLILASLMFVIAFGAIISYYIVAIESKLTNGEGTVVIYVYENGTGGNEPATSTDGGLYTIEPDQMSGCSSAYVQSQNLDDYRNVAYETDEQHPWPWLATIEYSIAGNQTNNQTETFQGCGGAFVAENRILTAAHCVDQNYIQQVYEARNKNAADGEQKTIMMRVKVGIKVNSTYTKYETFYAQEIIKHPNYTTGQPNNDLAVIHLNLQYGNDSKSHFCVIPRFEFMYVPANIYAISKFNKSIDYTKVVQKTMNLLNGSSCTDNPDVTFCAYQSEEPNQEYYQYKDTNVINDKIVYQGGDASEQPAEECGKQTSGLPLMQQLKDSSWSLVGIGSFSQNPCSKFTIYTKLDAYKQWINDAVAYEK